MASSYDATFKFVLIASIIVLITLAAISTLNCDAFHKNESFYASYSGIKLNPDVAQYWKKGETQNRLISNLRNMLNGSYLMVASNMTSLLVNDVFIVKSDQEIREENNIKEYKNGAKKYPLAFGNSTIEPLAKFVSAAEYLGDDSRSVCGTISQSINPDMGIERIKVRVLDSYYAVSSTCLKVQVKSLGVNNVTIYGSQSSALLSMLLPFGISSYSIFKDQKIRQLQDCTYSDSKFTLKFEANTSGNPQEHQPVSIVAYYLDYIGPVMDVTQQRGKNIAVATYVDYKKGLVGFNSGALNLDDKTPSSVKFDFSNYPNSSQQQVSDGNFKVYPGIVNPARLAVQFGYVYDTMAIDSVESNHLKLNDFLIDNSNDDKKIKCKYPEGEQYNHYAVVPSDTLESCYNLNSA